MRRGYDVSEDKKVITNTEYGAAFTAAGEYKKRDATRLQQHRDTIEHDTHERYDIHDTDTCIA